MPNFLHKASGTYAGGAFWSIGLNTSGAITEAAANTAWVAAMTAFFGATGVAALFSTGTEVTALTTSTASPTWRQTTITRATSTLAGTATTQELPVASAMVVTYRSTQATKSGHGRQFWFAPVAAALSIGSGGHISTGSSTTIAGGLTAWRTALTTAGLTPLILTKRATQSLPAYTTQAAVEWELVHTLATQKRRGDKLVPLRTVF